MTDLMTPNKITIEPVTRIEGHAKVTIRMNEQGKIPDDPELAVPTRVRSLEEVVPVDIFVPGCPPDADTIFYVLSELAQGRKPVLDDGKLQWH